MLHNESAFYFFEFSVAFDHSLWNEQLFESILRWKDEYFINLLFKGCVKGPFKYYVTLFWLISYPPRVSRVLTLLNCLHYFVEVQTRWQEFCVWLFKRVLIILVRPLPAIRRQKWSSLIECSRRRNKIF